MILKKIRYKDLENWSVKFLINSSISSKYEIKQLKNYIEEKKCKISPYNYPDKKFKILGVNNKIGLFDNEIKFGKEINQDYKIVRFHWFAYNPYRINVGSIGLKTNKQKYRYISPAYVVFKIKDKNKLLPEYLFLVFKTSFFLKIIRNNTKGSVRQILSYDLLEKLKIPLPDINTQKKLVEKYQKIKEELEKLELEYPKLLEKFEKELFIGEENKKSLIQKMRYKDLENWSVKSILGEGIKYNEKYSLVKLGDILKRNKTQIEIQDNKEYKRVTIRLYNGGIFLRDKKLGKEIGTKKQFVIKKGQFLLSKIDARNGAFGIVPNELDGAIITADFLAFDFDKKIYPSFLNFVVSTKDFYRLVEVQSKGTTGRKRVKESEFLNIKIPLPDINTQKALVEGLENNLKKRKELEIKLKEALKEFEDEIFTSLKDNYEA